LDEKFFILEKLKRLLKRFDDSPPEVFHHIQLKSHPSQVLCTEVIARPRMSETSGEFFDGLLTLMPHINWEPAKRNSINRPRGTPVPKSYTINAENFYECMTMEGGIIEAIEDVFRPHLEGRNSTTQRVMSETIIYNS
jgi:hypothetical protein